MLGVVLTAGLALSAKAQFNMGRLASLSLANGAEINAYDATTKRLFVVSGKTSFDVVSLADPANPQLVRTVDLAASNAAIGGLNSVSVKNGVAVFAAGNTDKTQAGFVVFVATAGNNAVLNTLTAGALPDMVTFSHDGNTVLVANEGEPNDAGVNPEGSVTLIDLTGKQVFSLTQADATQLSLTGFNDKKAALEARGVRMVFPNATVAQAIEPEYIAVTPDNTTAFVACQENNAYLVVNIAGKAITDILPLGFKDHSRGPAKLTQHLFTNLPDLGVSTTGGGTNIALGGMSGLWHAADESFGTEAVFYAVPDRGPNGDVVNGQRQFLLPNYQARIVRFTLNTESGALAVAQQILLNRTNAVSTNVITGLPNIPGFDEAPVDGQNNPVNYDPYGADLEGIIKAPDGTFWACDEYRPSVYHFHADGNLIARYVPAGTSALGTNAASQSVGDFGQETLPAVYNKRRANRGFEAIALDTDRSVVYAFIQTPLDNPDSGARNSDVIRILGLNPTNGTPISEYVYLLERNRDSGHGLSRVDKLGDAVYAGNNQFYVIERDSSTPNDGFAGKKYVFSIDLTAATNIRAASFNATNNIADVMTGTTLESMTADQIVASGIRPVYKRKVLNLPSIGYLPSDKPEGIAIVKGGDLDAFGNPVDHLAVLNDNDFAGEGFPTVSLGLIGFAKGNRFDASNRDGKNGDLKNHPTLGMYQPDSITFYTGRDNETYLVSANEGDAADYPFFSEESRVKDLTLDSARFPNASDLQKDENLGRLNSTTASGDLDGDGDTDVIYSYGARSFTIWDKFGNLVYDSSDKLEIITKLQAPHLFNANNGSPSDVDSRSDDKGPEPEALTVGTFGTNTLVFVGMERSSGGIAVADVSNPRDVKYLGYFYQDGDIAPEGLTYIPAANSPSGKALLIVSYEVSNNVVIYELAADRSRLISDAQAHRLFAHNGQDIGEGPFSYQWRKDGQAIVGATAPTFDPTVGGAYDVLITDASGNVIASDTFNLTRSEQIRLGGVKIEGPATGVTFRIEAVDALGNVINWTTVSAAGDLGDGRYIDLNSANKNIKFFRVVPVQQP